MNEIMPVLSQAFDVMKDFGALSMHMKIAAVLTLLISLVKVSAIRPIWEKLGAGKVLVAPLLSLMLAIVQSIGEKPVTKVEIMNALLIGAGSVAMHEFLDALKEIPVIKQRAEPLVDLVKKLLSPKKA